MYIGFLYIKSNGGRTAETRHTGKPGETTSKRRGSLLNYLDQTQTNARKLGQEEEEGSHQEDVHGG
jgi:hypothetical protein